jgi:hypothetical protein
MAIKFKVGAVVRQVMPAPIEGTVIDTDGNRTARFFSEAQIEAVGASAGE